MLDYGQQIYDGDDMPAGLNSRVTLDIGALRNLAITGQRAMWELVVSPNTYREVTQTADRTRREQLETWFGEIWHYWQQRSLEGCLADISAGEEVASSVRRSGVLDCLPDDADRTLLVDALLLRCDLFCTRDWTTILKQRGQLVGLGIEIVTPTEWWRKIEPYAGLWA
jgi:hypothetical protein